MAVQSPIKPASEVEPNRQPALKNRLVGYLTCREPLALQRPTTPQIVLWALLLVVVVISAQLNSGRFQLGTYWDDAAYTVLAKSLVEGPRFGLINVPGEPLPTRYPFGFPLLLAPVWALFPNNLDALKGVSLICTVINLSLLFWLWPFFSRAKSYWWGLGITALSGLSPLVIGHTDMVMSEPAFTTFVLLALALAEWCVRHRGRRWWVWAVGLGLCITVATSIRTLGLLLLVALVARFALLPGKTTASRILIVAGFSGLVFYGAVILITPVTLQSLLPTEYLHQFEAPKEWGQPDIETNVVERFLGGTAYYAQSGLREVIVPTGESSQLALGQRLGIADLPRLLGIIITAITIIGLLGSIGTSGLMPTLVFFEIVYVAAITVWPWRLARFLYPLQPFLMFQFLSGILIIAAFMVKRLPVKIRRRRFRLELAVVALVALALLSLNLIKIMTAASTEREIRFTRDLRIGTDWVQTNTNPQAVLLTQQAQSIFLYTNRKTVEYGLYQTPAELLDVLRTQQIDYIFIAPELQWNRDGVLAYDSYTSTDLLPMLDVLVNQGQLALVYESDPAEKVRIYQYLGGGNPP